MRRRQPGEHRDPQQQDRRFCLVHEGEEHRREQHETDLKEDRQSDDQRGQHDRPFEPALAQRGHQRAGDDNGTSRFGQQLADHRAETDDDA